MFEKGLENGKFLLINDDSCIYVEKENSFKILNSIEVVVVFVRTGKGIYLRILK